MARVEWGHYDGAVNGIRCEFVFLAQRAEYQQNTVNIYGVTALAFARKAPFRTKNAEGQPMNAVAFWVGPKNTKATAVIRVTGPGAYAFSRPFAVTIGPTGKAITLTALDLTLPAHGEYLFEVVFDEERHAATTFVVMPDL